MQQSGKGTRLDQSRGLGLGQQAGGGGGGGGGGGVNVESFG